MVAETRSKTRKGAGVKSTPAHNTQRSLRDMFASTSKQALDETPATTETPVIELLDSSSEAEVIPTTPKETEGEREVSDIESNANESIVVPVQPTQPALPKKLFSIFERPNKKESTPLQETDPNIIHLSDNDSCTEEPTPYERKAGQHLFSISSSSNSVQGKTKLTREGSSRGSPIVVDGKLSLRPSRTTGASSSKPVYSIFASKQKSEPKAVAPISGPPTPFPDETCQHIHGPQTAFPRMASCFPRSAKGKEPIRPDAEPIPPLDRVCSMQRTPSTKSYYPAPIPEVHAYIETIPPADQAIPSITRLLQHTKITTENSSYDGVSRERWADKWRPKRAEHVLGNDAHALYLRDWLMALRLQGDKADSRSSQSTRVGKKRKLARRKKPRIVRHVKKRRGKDYEDAIDDFLVSDESTDFEEEPLTAPSSDFDELGFSDAVDGAVTDSSRGSSPLTALSGDERPPPPPPPPLPSYLPQRQFSRRLTNTILLAGPHGSGKTAAVYACAEELGYEVFEVYPGIGERNGASLHKLVGDVGKNHLVKVKRHHTPEVRTNFFRKAAHKPLTRGLPRIPDSSDVESMGDELDIISSEPDEPPAPEPPQPSMINQSLILVEEADILYQTDSNFWPALINIIKDCKRPVILTCNDISLVPCQDLPLQDILRFQPSNPSLAASYLQALCLAEGSTYPRQELTRIYQNFETSSYPIYDLRHAIDHLQFSSMKLSISSPLHQSPAANQEPDCIPISLKPDSSIPLDSHLSDPLEGQEQDSRKKLLQTLTDMSRFRETQSFVDAELCRETNTFAWNLHLNETLLSEDDELGYTILRSDRDLDCVPVSSYYDQDENIREDVLERAFRLFLPQDGPDRPCTMTETISLEYQRRVYLATAGFVLRRLTPSHAFVSDAALHLDFAPVARNIMEVELIQEAQLQPLQHGSQGRLTRNSQRTELNRWLPLNDGERTTFWNTRLPPADLNVGTA